MKKGGQGPTAARLELAVRVRDLYEQGLTFQAIANRLGFSRSYVNAVYHDPDGKLDRARKESYAGVCLDCGAPTSGSNGPNNVPEFCEICAPLNQRRWTREAVLLAIQAFARIHGRPPTANEWNSTVSGGRDQGYPSLTSIYGPGGPFGSWAEAVEAAGFPRPYSGRRTIKEGREMTQRRAGYVILHEREDGLWEVLARRDEGSAVGALNAVLGDREPSGRWVAIPGTHWRPRALTPRTIYDWVEEPGE